MNGVNVYTHLETHTLSAYQPFTRINNYVILGTTVHSFQKSCVCTVTPSRVRHVCITTTPQSRLGMQFLNAKKGWNQEDMAAGVIKYGVANYEPRRSSACITKPTRPALPAPPVEAAIELDGDERIFAKVVLACHDEHEDVVVTIRAVQAARLFEVRLGEGVRVERGHIDEVVSEHRHRRHSEELQRRSRTTISRAPNLECAIAQQGSSCE